MSKGLEGAIIGIYDELQSSDQYGSKFMTLMEVRGDNVKNDNSGASGGITYQIEVFTETPANSICRVHGFLYIRLFIVVILYSKIWRKYK